MRRDRPEAMDRFVEERRERCCAASEPLLPLPYLAFLCVKLSTLCTAGREKGSPREIKL